MSSSEHRSRNHLSLRLLSNTLSNNTASIPKLNHRRSHQLCLRQKAVATSVSSHSITIVGLLCHHPPAGETSAALPLPKTKKVPPPYLHPLRCWKFVGQGVECEMAYEERDERGGNGGYGPIRRAPLSSFLRAAEPAFDLDIFLGTLTDIMNRSEYAVLTQDRRLARQSFKPPVGPISRNQ
jgi:hypothetical protein